MQLPLRVGVLISGDGHEPAGLIDADADIDVGVRGVEPPRAAGLERAAGPAIPSSRVAGEDETTALLAATTSSWSCSPGYMRILTAAFVGAFAGRIVRAPALLPAFPGAHAIADASPTASS